MKLVDIDPGVGLLSATASVGLSSGTGTAVGNDCGWERISDKYSYFAQGSIVPDFDTAFNADPIKIDYSKLFGIADPQKVIFNPPATIVIWKDGSKTVVKCKDGDIFEPWTGFAMCICKRIFGDEFHSTFRKYCDVKMDPMDDDIYYNVNWNEIKEKLKRAFGEGGDDAKRD